MLPFAEACCTAGPLTIALEDGRGREVDRRTLDEPFLIVGRHEAADWQVAHDSISRRHAYLQVLDGRLAFFDLASRSGLRVEGSARRSGWVEVGDSVGIGPYRIRNLGEGPGGAPSLPVAAGSRPDATLEFLDHASGPVNWRMNVPLAMIGRSPSCKIRLPEDEVSQFHCNLVQTRSGLWAVDLISRSGTLVNGRAIRSAPLADGAIVQVGRRRIRVRLGATDREGLVAGSAPAVHRPADARGLPDDLEAVVAAIEHLARTQQRTAAQVERVLEVSRRILGMVEGATAGRADGAPGGIADEVAGLRRELASLRGGPDAPPSASPDVPPPPTPPARRPDPPAPPDVHFEIQRRLAALGRTDGGFWPRLFRKG